MKKKQAALVDLHYDIFKEIMIRVARSSDGAKDFAKAISVCKAFRWFVEDGDVLRSVAFQNFIIDDRWELFQLMEGLICRCAQAGHEKAKFLLAKIILVSSSHMLVTKKRARDREKASSSSAQAEDERIDKYFARGGSFLENFLCDRISASFIGYHYDFVKIFLSQARLSEFEEMRTHLFLYLSYFTGRRKLNTDQHITSVMQMLDLFKMVCSFEEDSEHAIQILLNRTNNLELLDLLKKQVGSLELGAVEREEICTHNFCTSTTTPIAKLDKASWHSAKTGVQRAQVLSSLPAFEEVTAIMNEVSGLKAKALFFQEARTILILGFHAALGGKN